MTDRRITGELRRYVNDALDEGDIVAPLAAGLMGIAGRIDDADARATERSWDSGFDSGFYSADHWHVEQDEATLAQHGLVRVPVDADGETFRLGETVDVEVTAKGVTERETVTISGLRFDREGWELETPEGYYYPLDCARHHRATAAERLRRVADRLADGEDAQGFVGELADIAAEMEAAGND